MNHLLNIIALKNSDRTHLLYIYSNWKTYPEVVWVNKLLSTPLSVDQILTHWYATTLMSIRYAFQEARDCISLGTFQ